METNYRDLLIIISNDRKELQNKREELLNSDKRIEGVKLYNQLTSLIQVQDKLINYVSILEKRNVSEVRDEFDFTY